LGSLGFLFFFEPCLKLSLRRLGLVNLAKHSIDFVFILTKLRLKAVSVFIKLVAQLSILLDHPLSKTSLNIVFLLDFQKSRLHLLHSCLLVLADALQFRKLRFFIA
jgi:hypothetical protein